MRLLLVIPLSLVACDLELPVLVTEDPQVEPDRSATITWDAPTESADGTALDDLAGFKVYVSDGRSFTADADVTSIVVEGLDPGSYTFEVTALDHAGNESARSNSVEKVIQ